MWKVELGVVEWTAHWFRLVVLGGCAIDSLVGGDSEIRGQNLHFPFYSFPFLSLGIGGGLARRIFRRWEILHFRNGIECSLQL